MACPAGHVAAGGWPVHGDGVDWGGAASPPVHGGPRPGLGNARVRGGAGAGGWPATAARHGHSR